MTTDRYTSDFAAKPFRQVKDTDSNDEYAKIQSAFKTFDDWSLQTASMQITDQRNILVDPSGVVGTGNAIVIMLPASPAVGDPPCRVMVLSDSYVFDGSNPHTAIYVQGDTGASDPVMGSLTTLPRMYNGGAFMEFVWIGGTIGWSISSCEIGTYAAGLSATNDGPNGASAESFAAPYFEAVAGAGIAPGVLLTDPPRQPGQWCAYTFTDDAPALFVGKPTDLVNAVAGPVEFIKAYNRLVITCITNDGLDHCTFVVG